MFLATPVPQMQTGPFSSVNCGPAATELLIKLASVDARRVTAQRIRDASGDRSGGIDGALLASTANRLTNYDYPLAYGYIGDWAFLRDRLEHSSIALIINCARTVRTQFRTNGFTGNHWIVIAGGTIRDGTVLVEDPGTTTAGWKRWPLSLLRYASDFGGYHWRIDSKATEDTDKRAVMRAAVRARPDRDAKRIGRLEQGERIHVRKTTRGGPWERADGTNGHGWHVVDWKGDKGYVKGEGLR